MKVFKTIKKFSENINLEPIVTPWRVEGKIDYLKLVNKFGTEIIDQELIMKFKSITGKEIHPWIKRGIFFTHRGLNQYLDAYANGDPVFLYTGRGPTTDAMHLGHLIPFMFTKWIQDIFNCPLVIQIADDEKSAFRKKDFNEIYLKGFENANEIISLGFRSDKTFIFSNRDYRLANKNYETLVSEMKNNISAKEVIKIFGFDDDATVAMYDWPFYQTAAAFSQAYPHIFEGRPAHCLIPHAIDQDPYFRMARDIAVKMNLLKPCSIMSTFIPPLSGESGKMSSSVDTNCTIFLNDSKDDLIKKIMKYCFSGGGGNGSLEDHRKFGGNPNIDISYQYLRYFEFDDDKLDKIKSDFSQGIMSCGEIKSILVEKLVNIISDIQKNKIDEQERNKFYEWKKIDIPKKINYKKLVDEENILYDYLNKNQIEFTVKYHSEIQFIEENEFAASLQGIYCKTMLLKGMNDEYYLFVHDFRKIIDLKTLAKDIKVKKLNVAKVDTIKYLLNTDKYSINPFSTNKDKEKKIVIIFDRSVDINSKINFRPFRNDATITINFEDVIKILTMMNNIPIVLK